MRAAIEEIFLIQPLDEDDDLDSTTGVAMEKEDLVLLGYGNGTNLFPLQTGCSSVFLYFILDSLYYFFITFLYTTNFIVYFYDFVINNFIL